ncbi:unnamed protein product [Rhizophagus irregularis]|nr:unnamed protein product [Rhizophagus irregularis]
MEQDNDNANENITLSTETDSNSNLRHRCFDCEFSGSEPKENNRINKRNKGSKKTECPWIINLLHSISHSYIKVTKFVNNHNHQLLADTELFSTEFRSLSDDIKQDINYYVECGVCDFPIIRALLEPKYQNQFMLSQNLSNYIQKVKRDKADTYNDSARLLENLLAQQQEDPLMLVIPRIDPITLRLTDCNNKIRLLAQAFVQDETECSYVWLIQCLKKTSIIPHVIITDADPVMLKATKQELPNTFHIHCIFHIAQNLPKRLKAVLGRDYFNFVNDFYKAQNSITVEIFEKRWQNLVSKYSQTESYLHNILYKSKKSWAYCFTLRLFTGDIQSTQRVESLNGILHKAIESKNLNDRFITYKYAKPHYNQPYMVAVIFKNISTLISYWLSSNLFEEFKKQMVESVSYRARIVQQLEVLLDKQ